MSARTMAISRWGAQPHFGALEKRHAVNVEDISVRPPFGYGAGLDQPIPAGI